MDRDISVILTTASLAARAGGPTRTVLSLRRELIQLGVNVLLLSRADGEFRAQHSAPIGSFAKNFDAFLGRSGLASVRTISLRNTILEHCRQDSCSLIHDNGLWLPANHAAVTAALAAKVPLIITTHGMLEPWAMKHRAWKKQLAWRLYQRRDLTVAQVLHATAEQEALNLRRLGLTQPIAVIPNGIEIPASVVPNARSESGRIALFIGRLHPVKGLLELVEAWRIVRPVGWRMVVAGPDEAGHGKVVRARVRDAGLSAVFDFVGSVDDPTKNTLYEQADFFVLPSFNENFGLVIGEALASGVPVITTRATPWSGLLTHRCGWWVDVGAAALVPALREATSASPEVLREMGQRGRSFVEQSFGWPGIAEQMLGVYRWMLGLGDRPDCVIVD